MQQIASNLLLLTTSLSQLKNVDNIKSIFLESLHKIFTNSTFQWANQYHIDDENNLEVSTRLNSFGAIQYHQTFEKDSTEFALFQNSVQMLAIIIENVENEKLLSNQKNLLKHLVIEQTKSLIQKQDELNEVNEEYVTLNDEIIKSNQNLVKLNNDLINEFTKQKSIQEELRESNAYLESLFNYSNSPILVWDNCFIITRFNPAFEKLSGFKSEEVIGKSIDVLFPPEAIEASLELLAQTLEGERIESVEIEIIRKDGKKKSVVWNSAGIYDSTGENIVATVVQGYDITEMRTAFESLKLAESRLSSFIDGTRAGTWEWNIQTGETIYNETWANIVGYTLKELEPVTIQTWINLTHPDDLIKSREMAERHFKGEADFYEVEVRMKHKNGNWVWINDRGKVTSWDKKGLPLLMSGTLQDITRRKQFEINLRDSEKLLNESQKISLIGSYTLDMKIGIWSSSQILNEIFGIEVTDDHSIEGWLNLIHPDDQTMMKDYFFNEVMGLKKRFDKEYRIVSVKTKQIKWVHGIGELEFDNFQNPLRMIGTIQDITERKKVMDDLFESNELLTHFVLHSPIYAFIKEVTPSESKVLKASENYVDMVGIPGSEMVGKNMFELFPENFAKQMTADDWQVVSEGKQLKLDEELNNRYYTSIKFPIKLGNKNLLAGYTIDITDRKQAELMVKLKNEELIVANKKLKKAVEKAEESDRLKTSFLANMSHEIRTPLNSIMGFASLLPDEESKPLIDQYTQIILQNSEQLVSIIDGIVLYSKLQTGLLACFPSQFFLNNLFTDILQSYNLPEYRTNVKLQADFTALPPITVYTDYDKLRQILTNLISNAFKYTKKGFITLIYIDQNENIEFQVKDTGVGIPENEMSYIFDRFYRGSNVEKSSIRGTGLGLSIVKELVELLGGKIWVESKLDFGTTFHFTVKKAIQKPGNN